MHSKLKENRLLIHCVPARGYFTLTIEEPVGLNLESLDRRTVISLHKVIECNEIPDNSNETPTVAVRDISTVASDREFNPRRR